jgi:hypothetical protein
VVGEEGAGTRAGAGGGLAPKLKAEEASGERRRQREQRRCRRRECTRNSWRGDLRVLGGKQKDMGGLVFIGSNLSAAILK